MKYSAPHFITPPRPETVIDPSRLSEYENSQHVLQLKLNGTNSEIIVCPDKKLIAYNRHNQLHKAWKFDDNSSRIFKNISQKGYNVFNGELLHNKVKGGPRNTHYLYDILVFDGEYLLGKTYAERYKLLCDIFLKDTKGSTKGYWILDEYTWLARNIRENFLDTFNSLSNKEEEGVVIKALHVPLQTNNNAWMVKARIKTNNYPK